VSIEELCCFIAPNSRSVFALVHTKVCMARHDRAFGI
jgi:hypothetical protein